MSSVFMKFNANNEYIYGGSHGGISYVYENFGKGRLLDNKQFAKQDGTVLTFTIEPFSTRGYMRLFKRWNANGVKVKASIGPILTDKSVEHFFI